MPVAAVVIPASNEASVIGACLMSMLQDSLKGEFEIIVAANGCTDHTVEIARAQQIRTITLDRASKQAALAAADETTHVWPRIYVNAHARVDAHALRETAHAIVVGRATSAIPTARLDTSESPWYLRALFFLAVPSYAAKGVYALSHEAHARLGHNIGEIAKEAVTVPNATFVMAAPKTLSEFSRSGFRLRRPWKRAAVRQYFGRWRLVRSWPTPG